MRAQTGCHLQSAIFITKVNNWRPIMTAATTSHPAFRSPLPRPHRAEAKSQPAARRLARSQSVPAAILAATPAHTRSQSVDSPSRDSHIPGLELRLREVRSTEPGAPTLRADAPARMPLRHWRPELIPSVVTELADSIPDGLPANRRVSLEARDKLTLFFTKNCIDFFIGVRTDLSKAAVAGVKELGVPLQKSFERHWTNVSEGVLSAMSSIALETAHALQGREDRDSVLEKTREALFDVFVEALTNIHTEASMSLVDRQQRMDQPAMLQALRGSGYDQRLAPLPKEQAERMVRNPLQQQLDFSEAAMLDRKSVGAATEAGFNAKQVRVIRELLERVHEMRADPRLAGDSAQARKIADHVLEGQSVPGTLVRQQDPGSLVGALKKLLGATADRDGLLAGVVASAVKGAGPEDAVDFAGVDPRSLAGATLKWLAVCLRNGRYVDANGLAVAAGQFFFTASEYAPPQAPAVSSAPSTPRRSGFLSFFNAPSKGSTFQAPSTPSSLEASQRMVKHLEEGRRAHAKLISAVRASLDDKSSPWYEAPPNAAGTTEQPGASQTTAKPGDGQG